MTIRRHRWLTVRRGRRKGEAVAKIQDKTRRRLERLGRERALIDRTLVLTGLRKGELASLTAGQLALDADPAYLVLDAADEKNREGNSIPLRGDLAADLRDWLADKAKAAQADANETSAVRFDREAAQRDGSKPGTVYRLPADAPVFTVPRGLVRILVLCQT